MIRVTLAQAQQFILWKNYLSLEKAGELLEPIERLVGLPGEPALTPFLALRARLAAFRPAQLLDTLYRQRRLIKAPLMHNTSYIVPVEQYPSLMAATARQRNQAFNAEFRLWGLPTNEEIESLAQAIMVVIGEQPESLAAITARLQPEQVRELSQTSRGGRVTTTSTIALALRWLVAGGKVAVFDTSPAWWQEAPAYARLSAGYPDLDLETLPSEAEAQKALAWAYLAAFGPATEADLSAWTGFGKSETARATGSLSSETTLAMIEGIPGMLLTLKSQIDALKAIEIPATPIVNLLPAGDPFPTAHRASRSRYFNDQKLQRQIFSNSGAAKPTILVNGQIVGVWDWQSEAGHEQLTWQLLTEVEPATTALIEAELERVRVFMTPAA